MSVWRAGTVANMCPLANGSGMTERIMKARCTLHSVYCLCLLILFCSVLTKTNIDQENDWHQLMALGLGQSVNYAPRKIRSNIKSDFVSLSQITVNFLQAKTKHTAWLLCTVEERRL
jgi:hypothetical protein